MPQADPTLVDDLIEGVSHDDSLPPNSKDEPMKKMMVSGAWATTKWRIAWMDSPLLQTLVRSVDFLLGESDILINISYDNAYYQS